MKRLKSNKYAGSFEIEDEKGNIKEIHVATLDLEGFDKLQEVQDDVTKTLKILCPDNKPADFRGVSVIEVAKVARDIATGNALSVDEKKTS